MYASAQKVRMGYSDMVSNASKSMTLAGEAFQGNMDNAIRFQEIMSEAYTLGGASAAEQSTSMYQMIQALGAGTLAGDELRSVREGAPLAYQAIEKFAQGIYNTDESLKDLASQGKITSDMVVAAIMDSGKKMDEEFAKTKITFAQGWEMFKNTATKAFEPVLQRLAEVFQKISDSGALDVIANIFLALADVIMWVIDIIGNFFNWCSDNWYWLQYVVIGVLAAIAAHYIWVAGVATVALVKMIALWMAKHWAMCLILATIGALVAGIIWLSNTTVSGCEFMVYALLMVAGAIALIAVILNAWWLLWVALAIAVVALIIMFIQQILGAITWFGILCKNIGLEIANFFIALAWAVAYGFMTAVEFVVDIFNGSCSWIAALFINLGQTIGGIATNIGIFFSNAWNDSAAAFWNFIANCLEGLDWLAKPLESIAKLFGKSFDYSSFTNSIRNKADAYSAKHKDYVEWNGFEDGWSSAAWNKGTSKWSAPMWDENSSWSEKINTLDGFESGWGQEAYAIGAGWGDSFQNWVGGFGDKAKDAVSGLSLDNLTATLMTNSGLPSESTVAGSFKEPTIDELLSGVKDIDKNTGDINDKLSEDDLEYLRRLASMEAINKFTTAEIKVDMTNNNNINSERDWEDILTYLSDRVSEEARFMANGIHN
jgi:tape measure domain-containing protein